MRHTHPNLPGEIEIYNTGVQSHAGGHFYQFYLVREPEIKMDLCKNLKSDEEAIKYFNSIYDDKTWVDALIYLSYCKRLRAFEAGSSKSELEDEIKSDWYLLPQTRDSLLLTLSRK